MDDYNLDANRKTRLHAPCPWSERRLQVPMTMSIFYGRAIHSFIQSEEEEERAEVTTIRRARSLVGYLVGLFTLKLIPAAGSSRHGVFASHARLRACPMPRVSVGLFEGGPFGAALDSWLYAGMICPDCLASTKWDSG